jgi:hypothetical protein
LWSEGVKLSEIHRKGVIDEDFTGCATTTKTVDNFERVNVLVQENRRIIVTDTTNKLEIGCGSAYSIIHKDLGYHKFVQVGCRSSLQMSTNGQEWKSSCNFCGDIVKKERLSCNGFSQATNQQANVKA